MNTVLITTDLFVCWKVANSYILKHHCTTECLTPTSFVEASIIETTVAHSAKCVNLIWLNLLCTFQSDLIWTVNKNIDFDMQRTFDTILIAVILIASQYLCSSTASKNDGGEHQRSKRFVFLKGSGIGVSWKCLTKQNKFKLLLLISVFGRVGHSSEYSKQTTCLHGLQLWSAF